MYACLTGVKYILVNTCMILGGDQQRKPVKVSHSILKL